MDGDGRRIEVIGGSGVYLLVLKGSGDVVGSFYSEGDGWWRGRTPGGEVRRLWVEPDAEEPWREVGERMLRP
ncbi:hypothetical protein [Actinomadura macrotermitis]|uniref:Uncharacterized protein n=1 Tax=Actinomadura macrotermitis TaxID=2585200 RepID=A0A7K0BWY7_9ACTN|nr:hypothetical protein [Actinomadura macrotermitis]MQY05693.1 hypothetical protein [Actinomadura macrotermitis]